MNEIAKIKPPKFRQPKLATETDRQLFRRHGLAVALLGSWLASNILINYFLLKSHSNSLFDFFVCGSLGLIFSQWAVLSILFALFPAGLLFRTLLATTAIAASFLSIVMGEMMFGYWELTSEFSWQGLTLMFIGLAMPHLLARSFFGWHIRFDWLGETKLEPLKLAELMGWTAIIAFAIFMLQFLELPRLLVSLRFVLFVTGISFIILFPVAAQILQVRRPVFSLTILGAGALGVGVFAVMLLVSQVVSVPISLWDFCGLLFMAFSFLMSFAVALVAIRSVGGQLVTNRTESIE